MSDRLMIMSADCHGGVPVAGYKRYLEHRYHDELERYIEGRAEQRQRLAQFRARVASSTGADDFEERSFFSAQLDAGVRLKHLEADGVSAEVIFPDAVGDNEVPFSGPFGAADAKHDPDLHAAGQRAYNRWLAEFIDPARQVGLPLIATHDVESALKEIEWAASVGMRGLLFDGVVNDLPQCYEEYHDRIWSACEDVGLAVHYHAGAGGKMRQLPTDASEAAAAVRTHEVQFWAHRSLWYLLYGGVFERHPRLKVVFTEQFADWIPRSLAYADWQWEQDGPSGGLRTVCPRPPSEYYRRQILVGASVMSRAELAMRAEIGVEQMMFGTDFPHTEGTWGKTLEYLRATFGRLDVPLDEARALLGGTAAAFYGMDADLLESVAERCGPSVADVYAPITDEALSPNIRKFITRPVNPV
jgi:predicted TIM-barrel fold metal-dependent hydrolase